MRVLAWQLEKEMQKQYLPVKEPIIDHKSFKKELKEILRQDHYETL
jgi:hypothetical protein